MYKISHDSLRSKVKFPIQIYVPFYSGHIVRQVCLVYVQYLHSIGTCRLLSSADILFLETKTYLDTYVIDCNKK